MKSSWGLLFVLLVLTAAWPICASGQNNPKAVLETNFGDIVIELFPDDAPITVDNFLGYANSGFYDYLLFHRVDMNYEAGFFVIQGGAYYVMDNNLYFRPPGPPIINESYNGLSNLCGTIAMARTGDPNSATSQFFINQQNNTLFDRDNYGDGYGFCVFGQVVQGMNVVDAIADTNVIDLYPSNPDPFDNFPYNPMVGIYTAYALPCELSYCADLHSDGQIDLDDLAEFVLRWLDNDCNSANDFCGGADLDYNGTIDAFDYALFSSHWHALIQP